MNPGWRMRVVALIPGSERSGPYRAPRGRPAAVRSGRSHAAAPRLEPCGPFGRSHEPQCRAPCSCARVATPCLRAPTSRSTSSMSRRAAIRLLPVVPYGVAARVRARRPRRRLRPGTRPGASGAGPAVLDDVGSTPRSGETPPGPPPRHPRTRRFPRSQRSGRRGNCDARTAPARCAGHSGITHAPGRSHVEMERSVRGDAGPPWRRRRSCRVRDVAPRVAGLKVELRRTCARVPATRDTRT